MVICQSDNQLKTPGKVSWAFKMVSQFGSLGYTIMGKTADLTVFQKTIIDTLHKEGKPQTFIAKEAGCSQSVVSKHVNRKWSGRKKCGRKRCTTNRENSSLMRTVTQNQFKNLSELHKEWTEAGVKASRATTHRRVKEFGYSCHQRHLTWAKEKNWTVAQRSKVLFSDESKFCISFGNQESGGRVEKLITKVAWSWLNDHGVGVLDWPANSADLNPIENLWGIVKRKMRNKRPKMQMSWRPLSKRPGLPYHLSSATNWSPQCHAELRQ